MGKLKFLIADSQFLIIESLTQILEKNFNTTCVGVVSTSVELGSMLLNNPIDILIVDPEVFPDENMVTLKNVHLNFPNIIVIVITNKISKVDLSELSKIKVKTIIYKTIDKDDLLIAIESALHGKKYYSEEVLDLLMEPVNFKSPEGASHLTPSEIEIVRLIAGGLTTKEIASKKIISFHTVITHRKNIFRKLSINSSSELIMYAIRKGLIDFVDYSI